MAAFGQRGPLPRAALAAAGQSREALVPVFLERIERLTRAEPDVAAGDLAFIFIYHLLAEWRETRAYRPMLRLLRSDPEVIDALMGDGITECGARLVVSLFDGDLAPIVEAALDPRAEEFVRGQMLDALAMLALDQPPLRPTVEDVLRRFPDAAGEATPDIVWCAWSMAVAALGMADMTPAVRRAYEDGLIDPLLARFSDFEDDLAEAIRDGRPRQTGRHGPIDDAIAELSTLYCFSKAYLEAEARRTLPVATEAWLSRNAPKTGRNDPCPCGSGRKFKKCCLQ